MAKSKQAELQEQLLQLTELVGKLAAEITELKAQKPQQELELPEGELPPDSSFSKKGKPRPGVVYELLAVPTAEAKLQPQAVKIAILLSRALDTTHITEAEAMTLVKTERARRYLKTVQDPWRIFTYYKGKLVAGNFLREK